MFMLLGFQSLLMNKTITYSERTSVANFSASVLHALSTSSSSVILLYSLHAGSNTTINQSINQSISQSLIN